MLLAPPSLPAPPPRIPALAGALAAIEAARRLETGERPPSPELLRAHAARLAPAPEILARAFGPGDPRVPLSRGLQAALLALAGDEAQEKPWARATADLARGLRAAERRAGPQAPALLPWLEGLADLLRLPGLESRPWRERALRIRVATARKPDPVLERACAEALAFHYGPWLSFRPPDVPEVLAWTARLLDLWEREPVVEARTRRVAEAAFPGTVQGVWRLTGRHADPDLRGRIESLLDGLEAGPLAAKVGEFGGWVAAVQGGPWQGASRRLAARVDRLLEPDPAPATVKARVRLALAVQDPGKAAGILRDGLLHPRHGQAPEYLGAALEVLRVRHDPALADLALGRLLDPAVRAEAGLLLEWAEYLEKAGDLPRAEALHRRRTALDPAHERELARNLRLQGRTEEAWLLLDALRRRQEPEPPLDLLMECVGLLRERGDVSGASRMAAQAVGRWMAEGGRSGLLPGLASAVETLEGGLSDALREVLQRRLDPHRRWATPQERAVLLRALRSQESPAPWRRVPSRPAPSPLEELEARGGLDSREGVRLLVAQAGREVDEDADRAQAHLQRAQDAARLAPDLTPEDGVLLQSMAAAVAFLRGEAREGESRLLEALEWAEQAERLDDETRTILLLPFQQLWERCLEGGRHDAALAILLRLRRIPAAGSDAVEFRRDLDRMEAQATRMARLEGLLQAAGAP